MYKQGQSLHGDEFLIDTPLVRSLVGQARPDWAEMPIERLSASGSSNVLFRLGTQLLVRLPRQPGGSTTVLKEARWLPRLAIALPVATPQLLYVGEPTRDYPEHWSVVRWIDGEIPSVVGAAAASDPQRKRLAIDLANVVTVLHGLPVPHDAIADPDLRWYRGDPLATRDTDTREAIENCRRIPDLTLNLDAVLHLWNAAMKLPGVYASSPPRWYHGDLFAENVLVRNGRLAGLLDFGGLAVGDPTVDLIVVWDLLDGPARQVLRETLEVGEDTWLRGRAWALSLAVMTFPYYWRTMPERCASRLAALEAILADAEA